MFDPDYDILADIVAAGSLSAAARLLRVSPASLSKRLSRLEQRLGARLVHRTTRRLTLTPVGRELLDTLVPVRAAIQAAEDRIAGLGTAIAGPLRVTVPTSFGRMHLAPCLPDFLARYPGVELDLDLSDQFVDLLDGGYDLAIRIAASVAPGLVSYRLATSRRVLCASPGYLAAHGAPTALADLGAHRLIAAHGQLPWHLDGPDGSIHFPGESCVTTNSSEVVRELALGGCGIALRSLWDVAAELETHKLVRVLPQYEGSHDVAILAVHAPTPLLSANVRALIEHLQMQLRSRKGIGAE
jgi:DNA-binding transcriptional LysR family regulator